MEKICLHLWLRVLILKYHLIVYCFHYIWSHFMSFYECFLSGIQRQKTWKILKHKSIAFRADDTLYKVSSTDIKISEISALDDNDDSDDKRLQCEICGCFSLFFLYFRLLLTAKNIVLWRLVILYRQTLIIMILTVVEITMLSLHSDIDGFHWFFSDGFGF